MRTKAKFYKNLSNSYISREKQIERFELKDVKTVESLIKEASGEMRIAEVDELAVRSVGDGALKWNGKAEAFSEELEKIEKQWGIANEAYLNHKKGLQGHITNAKESAGKMSRLGEELKNVAKQLEDGAKAIGVPIPAIVNKATDMASKVNSMEKELDKVVSKYSNVLRK